MTTLKYSALSGRRAKLALSLLLLFFLAWDVRALLQDNRPGATVSDTTVMDVQDLRERLSTSGFIGWIEQGNVKGPLAGLMVWGLSFVVGDLLLAARLLSVLLHTLLLWLLFRLGRRITSSDGCGLLAVLISGTFPMEYGWFRLAFHDSLVAVAVVITLGMIMGEFSRTCSAAKLGLMLGLAMLTKLSYPIFLVLPGLWFLATRIRDLRAVARLLLTVALALLVMSWWLIPSWEIIVENLGDSSRTEGIKWTEVFGSYFVDLPGVSTMLLAALGCGVLALWRRSLSWDRFIILLSSVVGALAALVFLFDSWSRYLLPVFPVAGLLIACGLTSLGQWLRGHWAGFPLRPLAGALALALLAQYSYFNIVDIPSSKEEREFHLGMVAPDTRAYEAFPSAVSLVRKQGMVAVELDAPPEVWTTRGVKLPLISLERAQQLLDQNRKVGLVCSHQGKDPLKALAFRLREPAENATLPADIFFSRTTLDKGGRHHRGWLRSKVPRLVQTFTDPDGISYSVILLTNQLTEEEQRAKEQKRRSLPAR